MSINSNIKRWSGSTNPRGEFLTDREVILGNDTDLVEYENHHTHFEFGLVEKTDKFTHSSATRSDDGRRIICRPEASDYSGRSLTFYNNTRLTVSVVDRANLITTIKSTRMPTVREESIDITVTYSTANGSGTDISLHPEATLPDDTYIESIRNNTAEIGLTYVHRVYLDDIIKGNGSIYIHELDILLTIKGLGSIPLHPYSAEGVADKSLSNILSKSVANSTVIGYEIIDNNNEFGDKYVNIGGRILLVKAVKNDEYPSGVYTSFKGLVENNFKEGHWFANHYPFDVIEEQFPSVFFNSYKEAHELGSIDEQRDIQLKILEHEHKVEMEEIRRENLEHEKEIKDLKLLIEKVKKETVIETATASKETGGIKLYVAGATAFVAVLTIIGKVFL